MLEEEQIRIITQKWQDSLDTMDGMPLWEEGAPGFAPSVPSQRQPSLSVLPPAGGIPRGAVIVCAGGAYLCKSAYEGKPVAECIEAAGMGAAVLDYRVKPYPPEASLADAKRAIRLLRSRAADFNILPDKIAILGFSAGGHLAGLAATLYDYGDPRSCDPVERLSSRPDAAVQCYGSLSLAGVPGMEKLLDLGGDRKRLVEFSPDKNIHPDSPPFFLWQTGDDNIVSAKHILAMAGELTDHGVPYEMHLFPHGPHGLGLADGSNGEQPANPHAAQWTGLLLKWLESLGF